MTTNDLGAFLATCRASVRPEDVALTSRPGRRVAGLRREEVAMLAGVSVDYYARLEQGRERTPSAGVLNTLATALALDTDQREHLFRLTGLTPLPDAPEPTAVDADLRELLHAWPETPALILNRQLDVLACNGLAHALYGGFARVDNLATMTFLDPCAPQFFIDYERAQASCVANLRLALGHRGSAHATRDLVARLHNESAAFREVWDRAEVRGKTAEAKSFRHPHIGDLTLNFTAFDVRSAPGHQLIVYRAEAGTASADKLTLLGSLQASTV